MGKESDRIEKEKADAAEADRQHSQLQADYQNMSAGISSSQGDEGGTLPEQISNAHSDSKTAEAKAKQAKMKIDHLKKELQVRYMFVTFHHCLYVCAYQYCFF